MRIVTWNCRVGAFVSKADRVSALRPDLLVVQEVENLDQTLLFTGAGQPTFRHRTHAARFPKRGTAVFSYTSASIQNVDPADAAFGFNRYEVQFNEVLFNLAAVWTWATKPNADSYRQAHKGLSEHEEWVRKRPTVMLGDFNMNKKGSGKKWKDLEALLDSTGFVSVYHATFKEAYGSETRPTHYHLGKDQSRHHIDYCFVPKAWESRILGVEVPDYAAWRDVSDHVPLIVDLDL